MALPGTHVCRVNSFSLYNMFDIFHHTWNFFVIREIETFSKKTHFILVFLIVIKNHVDIPFDMITDVSILLSEPVELSGLVATRRKKVQFSSFFLNFRVNLINTWKKTPKSRSATFSTLFFLEFYLEL